MLQVTDDIQIDDDDIEYRSLYSSGPGGQHVNKTMTAVQLRFNISQCQSLPDEVKQRLIHLGGARVNNNDELVITARRHRSQERNRREVIERLCELIRQAAARRKPRLKRRRSKLQNQKRLDEKRKHADKKLRRGRIRNFD